MTADVVDSRHRGPAGTDEAPSAPPPAPAPRTGRRPVARVLAAYAVSRLVTLAAAGRNSPSSRSRCVSSIQVENVV